MQLGQATAPVGKLRDGQNRCLAATGPPGDGRAIAYNRGDRKMCASQDLTDCVDCAKINRV